MQSSIASDDDEESEQDGKMSLGEFLQTCNNSPKSRVCKLLYIPNIFMYIYIYYPLIKILI